MVVDSVHQLAAVGPSFRQKVPNIKHMRVERVDGRRAAFDTQLSRLESVGLDVVGSDTVALAPRLQRIDLLLLFESVLDLEEGGGTDVCHHIQDQYRIARVDLGKMDGVEDFLLLLRVPVLLAAFEAGVYAHPIDDVARQAQDLVPQMEVRLKAGRPAQRDLHWLTHASPKD